MGDQAERLVETQLRAALPDGARLIVKRNPGAPLVNIQVLFLGGVRQEPPGKAGLSNLTARLMLRGTTHRTRAQIDAAMRLT